MQLRIDRAGKSFGIVRNHRDTAKISAQRDSTVGNDVDFA